MDRNTADNAADTTLHECDLSTQAVAWAQKQPWDMTSDERALEVERLREQFRAELATPLMSEGSLSPAQLGRMSQKQRAKYQRDAQTRMRVEARIRELRRSDDELAKDRQSAIRKKAKSELSQLSRLVKDLLRVGVSGKTGKLRPIFQRQIEQAQARIAEIEAAHPDLASPPKAVPDTSLLTLTRRGTAAGADQ